MTNQKDKPNDELITHIAFSELRKSNDELIQKLIALEQIFNSAFPNADPVSHRKFHETLIETAEWYKQLRRTVVEKIVLGILLFGSSWLALAVWEHFKQQVQN